MTTQDQKIFAAWDDIHYALVKALRGFDKSTLMFFARRVEGNAAVSDAAEVVLEDMEEEEIDPCCLR